MWIMWISSVNFVDNVENPFKYLAFQLLIVDNYVEKEQGTFFTRLLKNF
jgi:hypothetical protein